MCQGLPASARQDMRQGQPGLACILEEAAFLLCPACWMNTETLAASATQLVCSCRERDPRRGHTQLAVTMNTRYDTNNYL